MWNAEFGDRFVSIQILIRFPDPSFLLSYFEIGLAGLNCLQLIESSVSLARG
jgi:hypothetical protein